MEGRALAGLSPGRGAKRRKRISRLSGAGAPGHGPVVRSRRAGARLIVPSSSTSDLNHEFHMREYV
jgi:hypothetical protein